jgi:hypothetical protein
LTNSAPALASSNDSAITTAIGSPTKLTLSFARGGLAGTFISVPSSLRIAQPAIRPPILSVAISSPVKILTMPEDFNALDVSIFLILALA